MLAEVSLASDPVGGKLAQQQQHRHGDDVRKSWYQAAYATAQAFGAKEDDADEAGPARKRPRQESNPGPTA